MTEIRPVIGYLHTGIEKNMEFRTWTQGTTFCTRMDYLAPLFNEAVYCLAVEKLLGIEDEIPERATIIRVLLMELNRISSHMMAIGTFGLELGATTVLLYGLREREKTLDLFELITGLRMNHAFIRPGGVAQDLPAGSLERLREYLDVMPKQLREIRALLDAAPIYLARTKNVAHLDLAGLHGAGRDRADPAVHRPALGPAQEPAVLRLRDVRLRRAGAHRRRCLRPVPGPDGRGGPVAADHRPVRGPAAGPRPGQDPVMIGNAKIGWPARLALGPDGMGNSPDHIAHIMGQSMEALIHHFKLVTEGFRVPAGQVYTAVESPRGELGCHAVSDGGTRPFRAHFRDPSFTNLQALAAMCEGGMVADVIAAVASIDPVMGGVDR